MQRFFTSYDSFVHLQQIYDEIVICQSNQLFIMFQVFKKSNLGLYTCTSPSQINLTFILSIMVNLW